jgi:hypothetical protein
MPDMASSSTDSLIEQGLIGRGATLPLAYESRRFNPKPFSKLEGGKEWNYARIVRVPDDDHVRPTTLEATRTKIRVGHKLCIEVKYRLEGKSKDMVLRTSTDVTIASVRTSFSSFLPSFEAKK